MNENLFEKCKSRIFEKSVSVKSKRKPTKLWLYVRIRCCIYVVVILLFYINVLWYDSDWRGVVDRVPAKQHQPTRQLRSLVSTSAIDLENSQENVSVTEASHSIHIEQQPTVVETTAAWAAAATVAVEANNTTQPVAAPWSTASNDVNCTAPAILEFPSDGLTRTQRQHGWIVLHILLPLYCFWLLAVICDDYFLPAIELICQGLHLKADVVGATLMAVATSSPGLFMNCIGTFVTQGDIGIGTIVGSSIFNLLAVPACCGLFVGQCVRLDWWPVSRDCLMYCMAVLALIGTLWDGKVMWYESLLLFVAYFCYMAVIFNNDKLAHLAQHLIPFYRRKLHLIRSSLKFNELTPLIGHEEENRVGIAANTLTGSVHSINTCASNKHLAPFHLTTYAKQLHPSVVDIENYRTSMTQNDSCRLTTASNHSNGGDSTGSTDVRDIAWQRRDASRLGFLLRWPISFLLQITVPDSRGHPRAKYLTFVASILWIALISYVVAYAITVTGDTLSIPDSVMGLTILSAGMSVPEAVSSIIVTKWGHGAMGIVSAMPSARIPSTFYSVSACLGSSRHIFYPTNQMKCRLHPTQMDSPTHLLLLNRFKLDRKVSWICAVLYSCFIVCAALIELNVFFPVHLPMCEH